MNLLRRHASQLLFLGATLGIFMTIHFARQFAITPTGAYVSHQHTWSDWGLHIAMTNAFATKPIEYWFSQHIIFAGAKFTYPFATNLISGLLVRAGSSLALALLLPSILYALLTIVGLYAFFVLLLKQRWSAVLAVYLVFFSSGLGFLRFFREGSEQGWYRTLTALPDFYSSLNAASWYSGNLVSGFLLPQRAFLLGYCVGIWILVGLLTALTRSSTSRQRQVKLVVAGLAAGVVPVVHMHTFIVLVILSALLFLTDIRRWKTYLWYAVPAGMLSSWLYWTFVRGGIENAEFFSVLWGYTASGGLFSWISLWWQLWGVTIPLALLGWFVASPLLRRLLLGASVIFILGNIILFQPIAWDNSKVFMWVYTIYSGAVAGVIGRLWEKRAALRLGLVALILCLTLTGALDLLKIVQEGTYRFQLNTIADVRLGEQIRSQTHPNAIFATAAMIQHPVMTWGARPVLMSYWAWAWNYGFDHSARNTEIKHILSGGEHALETLKRLRVSYVVIGPAERNDYGANERFFRERFSVLIHNQSYTIYDVRPLTGGP